jgi:hypothetical protein
MTIGDATHVTSAKPHHAALQRQALRPRALATQQSACTEPAIPNRSPISPVTASKTHAGSRQPLRATCHSPGTSAAPTCFPHRHAATAPRGFLLGRFPDAGRRTEPPRPQCSGPHPETFNDSDAPGITSQRQLYH